MNRAARRLGLARTVFYSPNGLDDRGHSTARAVATLTRAAERSQVFASIVGTKFASIPAPPGEGPRRVQNRNVLLWLYPCAIGEKTWYMAKSGYCLVAAAEAAGQRLLAVVLDDTSSSASFSDAAALLDYGFHSFLARQVVRTGELFPVTTRGIRYEVRAARSLWALFHA